MFDVGLDKIETFIDPSGEWSFLCIGALLLNRFDAGMEFQIECRGEFSGIQVFAESAILFVEVGCIINVKEFEDCRSTCKFDSWMMHEKNS